MLRLKHGVTGLAISLLALLSLSAGDCQKLGKKNIQKIDASTASRKLIWSDEFNGPSGSMPDLKKWTIVNDGSGFGNRELEYYTDRPLNLHQEKGNLIITARKEDYSGKDGAHKYTSARIESRGRFEVKYGRIEARLKLPKGQGIWSAFWMLGNDFRSTGWPACGEIDIIENVGFEPSKVHGSLHGPGYSGSNPLGGVFTLPNQARFSDSFHVFAIEWDAKAIRFYVDDNLYETQSVSSLPADKHWAFDHPFYIVLNVAVGGYWPGDPDATTRFPTSMLVDYVRVYRLGAAAN
jgi:beta-glucanase (GH16 family)